MRIVGIDPSLRHLGLAVIEPPFPPSATTLQLPAVPASRKARAGRVASLRRAGVKARDARPLRLDLHLERLRSAVEQVIRIAIARPVDLAVIEWLYTSTDSTSTVERGGLWWMLVERLDSYGVPMAVVPPTSLKQYATGTGAADKPAMVAAVGEVFPGVEIDDDNQADAVWLAAMGARRLGCPQDPDAVFRVAGMSGAQWPALLSDGGAA